MQCPPLPESYRAVVVTSIATGNDGSGPGRRHTTLSVQKLEQVPTPREGEILIRVWACGLNPADVKIQRGQWPYAPLPPSGYIPSWDAAGVVVGRGYGARRLEIGTPVYAYARRLDLGMHGTAADYVCVPECFVAPMPTGLSFQEAAAVPLAALTAYQALVEHAHVQRGQWVGVIGASGGVGSFAVSIAKLLGARVVAVASKANHHYLTAVLKADLVVDYVDGIVPSIHKVQPHLDVVFEVSENAESERLSLLARPDGTVVSIVNFARPDSWRDDDGVRYCSFVVEPNAVQLERIGTYITDGLLRVRVQKSYRMDEAVQAYEDVASGHHLGKIVMTMS